jgi:PAS domain S-box-containing protein
MHQWLFGEYHNEFFDVAFIFVGLLLIIAVLFVILVIRRKNETELRDSEKRLRISNQILDGVLAHTHMLAAYLDPQFNFMWVNQAYADSFRRETSFFPGKNLFHLSPHAENERIFRQVVETGESCFVEAKPFTLPDQPELGATFWDWSLVSIKNDAGQVTGLGLTLVEVTDRIQAQEATALFKYLFDNSLLTVTLADASDLSFIEVNEAFETATGYSREEVLGKSGKDLGLFPDMEAFQASIVKLMAAGRSVNTELQVRRKDGACITGLFSSAVISLQGRLQVLTMATDITDRKLAEKHAILAKEETRRFKAISDKALHGNAIIDMDTDRFLYVNEYFARIQGYTADELIGKHVSILHSEKQMSNIVRAKETLLKKGSFGPIELKSRHKNGTDVPVLHSSIVLRDEKGIPQYTASSIIDLTERKRMERQLQQAQKMESIGNLAGGIAHDFNNILFPIVGIAEMLMEDLPAGSIEREYAEEIYRAGVRGSELVKQILAFSRQSRHKMVPVRIQQILKEVFQLVRATIPSDIDILRDVQEDCGLVMADTVQVHQVCINLITNALHAVERDGGNISVSLKETWIEDDRVGSIGPGRYAHLSVSDTGCGIDPSIMEKIFEPYFTTKGKGKGTGLGLAVVYGIVKKHEGDIRITSEPGKGTMVDVFLPLLEKTSGAPDVPETDIAIQTGDEHILLVDDEPSVVQLGSRILENLGYRVTACNSSIEALETFQMAPNSFDLLITDMTMPKMTGDRLAKKIQSIRPDIPIIICTGFSERIDRDRADAMGVKGFLMKPVSKSKMGTTVRTVLDEPDKKMQV